MTILSIALTLNKYGKHAVRVSPKGHYKNSVVNLTAEQIANIAQGHGFDDSEMFIKCINMNFIDIII